MKKALTVTTSHTNVPMDIMYAHKYITLSADIMFVNKYPFFNTISRHIKFGTTDNVNNSKIPTLHKSLFCTTHLCYTRIQGQIYQNKQTVLAHASSTVETKDKSEYGISK